MITPTDFANEMADRYPIFSPEQIDAVEEILADLIIGVAGFGPADLERVRDQTRELFQIMWEKRRV